MWKGCSKNGMSWYSYFQNMHPQSLWATRWKSNLVFVFFRRCWRPADSVSLSLTFRTARKSWRVSGLPGGRAHTGRPRPPRLKLVSPFAFIARAFILKEAFAFLKTFKEADFSCFSLPVAPALMDGLLQTRLGFPTHPSKESFLLSNSTKTWTLPSSGGQGSAGQARGERPLRTIPGLAACGLPRRFLSALPSSSFPSGTGEQQACWWTKGSSAVPGRQSSRSFLLGARLPQLSSGLPGHLRLPNMLQGRSVPGFPWRSSHTSEILRFGSRPSQESESN